jgi:protein kinase-like protein/Regulator of Chromosome Condensation (RCC1) repeat protein
MPDQSQPTLTGLCAACQRPLSPNAPGGLCPACLLRRGVELVSASRLKPGIFVLPADEELALLFPEFEILQCLGHGGMGAVYKAVQRELDRTVAIKILPPETAGDPEFIERFRREAATLAHLDHPNIVKLFDYGQREEFAYFVMEFVDGFDLSRRLASGPSPMSATEAFTIVSQLCDALQHSHERGVVHRDIKPANILITRDNRVKVADFGLARLLHPEAGASGLTRSHATLGTPRYMAPEQMAGAAGTDHRVDIYALGVVLYEMLTGHLPIGHFDRPSEKVLALNPRIDEVVLRALSTEPQRRHSTAADVKSSLREAIEKPAPTPRERQRQLAWRAFAASLSAALAACAALLWANRNPGVTAIRDGERPREPSNFIVGRLTAFGSPLPSRIDHAVAVAVAAARDEFALALRRDGTVLAWGNNRFGQTNVPSGLNSIIAVAAGQGPRSAHALALRSDGTVVGWGDNTFGQATPPPALTHVIAIAAGELFSIALAKNGRVIAWGNPGSKAVAVPKDLPPASAIAAGSDFSVALLRDGRIIAWGENDFGQCDVPQRAVHAVAIAVGTHHVLALLPDGSIVAWGANHAFQCNVPANLPPASRVFAGGDGSAAVDRTGKLRVWGKFPGGADHFTNLVNTIAVGAATWLVLAR